jgi:two-component system response regulator YesN
LEAIDVPPSLIHLLEAGRWDAAQDKLVHVFDELDERWSESWEHCMEAGYRIASSFSHLAHKNAKSLQAILGEDFEPLMNGEPFRSIAHLRKWTFRALEKLKQASRNEIKAIRSIYVEKLQVFVEQNLHHDVSLRTMADHMNLHPTHLSKIYKLETGEGISDYIFQLRMERACHQLRTTDKKVYEIGSEIGYLDPAYFIKVFKRQFGLTPQEYRENSQ